MNGPVGPPAQALPVQPALPRNKYHTSIIYKVVHQTNADIFYVGGTTNFSSRKSQHKSRSQNPNDKEYAQPKYKLIRENGGWEAFRMVPIKEYKCETKRQLDIEEERMRDELKATMNSRRAYSDSQNSPSEEAVERYRENEREKLAKERLERAAEITAYRTAKPIFKLKTRAIAKGAYCE